MSPTPWLTRTTIAATALAILALPTTAAADRGHRHDSDRHRGRVIEHVDRGHHRVVRHGRDRAHHRYDRHYGQHRHEGYRHGEYCHDPWLHHAEWLILGGLGWHILWHDE